ncbi:MAG TPA: MltA domain-containing protein [Thermodesulfobacteriota bacterium]|nr:MltA domain-containing protein [Thermodesulfobacteriota bacterium]
MRAPLAGLLLLLLGSCVPAVPREDLRGKEPLSFREQEIQGPLGDDASRDSLLASVERSMAYLGKKDIGGGADTISGAKFSPGRISRSLSLFRDILSAARNEAELDRKVRESFAFYELGRGNPAPSILLTGYFEPLLDGSLVADGEYRYPLYGRPDDLLEQTQEEGPGEKGTRRIAVRVEGGQAVPYYSRKEIDTDGALQGRGLELVWLRDPWDRFVLHIQGSGQVRLPDGRTIRVGYATSNGRPYRSIGGYLLEQGLLSENEVSMGRIREFLQSNPGREEETLNINERYIFFRILADAEGPSGALAVPLTPGRSVATDLTLFPPGALAYLVSRQPDLDESGRIIGWKTLRRFVLNQDAGGAIKGPGRVDLFFGSGERAGAAAGEMKEEGKIFFLLAK